MGSDPLSNLILELKSDPTKGSRVPIGDTGEFARIVRHGRGDLIFYQEGDRALLFDRDAMYSPAVAKRSLKRWDNNDKVTDEERQAILERVIALFRARGWSAPPERQD